MLAKAPYSSLGGASFEYQPSGNAERIVRNPIREMLGVDKSPKSHDFSYVHFAFFAVTSSLYNCAEVESFCLVGLARWLGTVIRIGTGYYDESVCRSARWCYSYSNLATTLSAFLGIPETMIRRIVCLLLVPALFANQAAVCCAHAHNDSETCDFSARAHLHLSDHSHEHHSGQHHSHGHHHGSDTDATEHSSARPSNDLNSNLDFNTSPVDHDGDVVFIGEQTTIQNLSGKITVEKSSNAFVCNLDRVRQVTSPGHRVRTFRAGSFLPYSCATYLQVCTLLV